MKTYERHGSKIITRASAMAAIALIACATASLAEKGAALGKYAAHPNYHVRAAAFRARGGVELLQDLPEGYGVKGDTFVVGGVETHSSASPSCKV